MKTIVLTGGIGSGKSTVSSILRDLGAEVIDSDKKGQEVVSPGTSGWHEVVSTFGREILTPQGVIDRRKLAQIVFHDPAALQKLNQIVHPRVDAEVEKIFQKCSNKGVKAVFVEMAIIIETSWLSRVDRYWVVKAPKNVTLKRLEERGVSESDALARMANQPPVEEKIKGDIVIICNDGNLADLENRVKDLWNNI